MTLVMVAVITGPSHGGGGSDGSGVGVSPIEEDFWNE